MHERQLSFLCYVLISPDVPRFIFWFTLFQFYVTFILQWIAFIFGRDEEEDKYASHMQERQLTLPLLCTYLP